MAKKKKKKEGKDPFKPTMRTVFKNPEDAEWRKNLPPEPQGHNPAEYLDGEATCDIATLIEQTRKRGEANG